MLGRTHADEAAVVCAFSSNFWGAIKRTQPEIFKWDGLCKERNPGERRSPRKKAAAPFTLHVKLRLTVFDGLVSSLSNKTGISQIEDRDD